jgi:serine/threonine-protein kinase RsbT
VADERDSVIPIESDGDVVNARQQARAMASALELTSTDQTLLATAISEVARNITAYAVRGEVVLSVIEDDGGRRGIRVIARDHGPGIENVELALQDGYTSGGGLGLGLPGARRLVHHFEIETAPGRGTKVTLVMWERESARAA